MHRVPHRLATGITAAGLLLGAGLLAAACGGGGSDDAATPRTGPEVYAAYCATCHGAAGQGGVGPKLAGLMESAYPDIEDQIAVVTNGKATMPAWGSRLSAGQIRRVVEYERTGLGG
ncbi:MAG: cytochrome c [Actinobacteria bacterium]|nr:cytochrome c [Actinomycetota bacterium]